MQNLTTFFLARMFYRLIKFLISSSTWRGKPQYDSNFEKVTQELYVVSFSNKLYLEIKIQNKFVL